MNGHSVSDSSRVWHELEDVSHCKVLQRVFTFLFMHPKNPPTTGLSEIGCVPCGGRQSVFHMMARQMTHWFMLCMHTSHRGAATLRQSECAEVILTSISGLPHCACACHRQTRRCQNRNQGCHAEQMRSLTVCICAPQGGKKMPTTVPDAQSDRVHVCASGRQQDAENWARCTV